MYICFCLFQKHSTSSPDTETNNRLPDSADNRNQADSNEVSTSESQASTNKDSQSENRGENSPIDCDPILTYLDESCGRWRLNNFGLTLMESDSGKDLFKSLKTLARRKDKERLSRILTDIEEGRIINRADSGKDIQDESAT